MTPSADEVRARLRAQIAAIEKGSPDFRPSLKDGDDPDRAAAPSFPAAPEDETVRGAARPGGGRDAGCGAGLVPSKVDSPAILESDGAERAFRKIERLACAREQASEALRRRLSREGFEEGAVESALARALTCGLVDDRRYADVLVRSRLAQGKGRRGIAAELSDLGIDPDGVEALAEPAGPGDEALEVDRALAVLDRRPPRARNRRDAAYRRLAQKGYGASVASTAARLWCEAHPD